MMYTDALTPKLKKQKKNTHKNVHENDQLKKRIDKIQLKMTP